MSSKYCCNHVESIHEIPLHLIPQVTSCNDCDCVGPNLWLCLHKDCLHVGCSEKFNDHSTSHFKETEDHCVHINLSTKRIWCYTCETEVFFRTRSIVYEASDNEDQQSTNQNQTSNDHHRINSTSAILTTHHQILSSNATYPADSGDENQSSDSDDLSELTAARCNRKYSTKSDKHRGLVGLQNIGNTCYMNSALQALSNTLPLTSYFLECGVALQIASENKKPGLSRTYQHLMKDIWNKKTRGYVVPSGILYGIRNVCPMFRGYHQHDTQEFLRCFMDQLHEELKEPYTSIQVNSEIQHTNSPQKQLDYWRGESPSPSQSDGEYETCDSGVSERSSLSDDTERVSLNFKTITSSKRKLSSESCQTNSNIRKLTTLQQYGGSNVIDTQPSSNNDNNLGQSQSGAGGKIHKTSNKYRSIISDIFDGKLLSSVQCLTCDRISTRVETFQDLSLPIPGRDHITMLHQSGPNKTVSAILNAKSLTDGSLPAGLVTCADAAAREGWWSLGWLWGWLRSWFYGPAVSLHDCLAAFFSADELKGDNMYSCEKCNKLRNGVKFSKVIELPEVLCIHLKRFRHELMFSSKISNYVSFPMTGLDMRPYLHRDCVSEISEYELNSVICHHGTAGAGHYTCYALNPQRNAWFEFDDQCVTEVPPETVESCEAYVLFYRKCLRKITPIRQEVNELMEMQGAGDMRFYISRQWFTRFSTCAEPGPIDNTDFLCIHGAVKPNKMPCVDKLSIVVSQPVWEYLLKTFRGGPTCNHLYECPTCGKQAELHFRRIRYELETFIILNKKFQQQSNEVAICAISMKWLRSWQAFVKNQTDETPGPIDNTSIVIPGTNNINLSSDYAQISEELWMFLYRIYGGGPTIQLRSAPSVMNKESPSSTTAIIEQPQVSSSQQEDSAIESFKSETIPLVSPAPNSTSLSTSESDDGGLFDYQYTNSETSQSTTPNAIKQTFASPQTTTILASDTIMPGSKRPPKVYTLHTTSDRGKARRRRRSETSASTLHAQDHAHVHSKFSKYNITKRRSGPKKRTYSCRRNSDDLITTRSQSNCDQ